MAKQRDDTMTGPGGVTITEMEPAHDFARAIQLWMGRPKVGKTSTAAALGTVAKEYGLPFNPFFLLFEPGTGGVTINATSQKCPDCSTAKKGKCPTCKGTGIIRLILNDLEKIHEWVDWAAKSSFNPIVFDTMDAMYQAVMDGVCTRQGITSPYGANDNGVSWVLISDEIRELVSKLIAADKGIIFIMHVVMQRKRVRGGETEMATFNVPGRTRQYLSQVANQILHFDIIPHPDPKTDKDIRVLFGAPQAGIEAGDQWGIMPAELELGDNPKEAAERILTAWGYLEEGKK